LSDERYKTLIDYGRILAVFKDSRGEERSVSYIAKSFQMLSSKVSRMLKTLDGIGLFEKNNETGWYRIGGRCLQVGSLYTLNHPLHRMLLPHLEQISADLGLTTGWAIFKSSRILVVDRFGIRESFHTHLLGSGPPLHSSSFGKLFLACLDHEEREEIFQSLDLTKFTPQTITDLTTVSDELHRVRKRDTPAISEEHMRVFKACVYRL
jgi:DNA-binding IclR family transcriptional regulator